MVWPLPFIEQLTLQLGEEKSAFLTALAAPATIGIRTNPRKPLPGLPWPTTPIPWSVYGHYLAERPRFTLFPPLHAGAVYVQEPSSMFLEQAFAALDRPGPSLALDLCGAPGGKTTHLLSLLDDDSIVVTNEVIRSRVGILEEQVIKWGAPNTLVTALDPDVMARSGVTFDLVVVDAPCSGEGLFRKDARAAEEWSPDQVQLCAARQDRILEAAQAMTAPGGYLIYSTCTFETAENEAHSARFRASGWRHCPIPAGGSHGITPVSYQGHPAGYQFYPHKVRGEGFYISVWQKPGIQTARPWQAPLTAQAKNDWQPWLQTPSRWVAQDAGGKIRLLPKASSGTLQHLASRLKPKYYGLEAFDQKGHLLIPTHALALSGAVSRALPTLPLGEAAALQYLSRENLPLSAPKGWHLVTYGQLPLGWAKGLGHRINNYYPQHWRIRNLDKLR